MSTARATRALARSIERRSTSSLSVTSFAVKRVTRVTPSTQFPSARNSQRQFSSFSALKREEAPNSSGIAPPKSYSYKEIQDLSTNPSSDRILIDVREPGELLQTGRIPTAKSVPISSAPDAFFMTEEDFESKFGFPRPKETDEVIFYCKAGVRSRQASLLAGQARPSFGGKIGNYSGSWVDWEQNGGKVEREGEQGEQSSVSGVVSQGGAPSTPRP